MQGTPGPGVPVGPVSTSWVREFSPEVPQQDGTYSRTAPVTVPGLLLSCQDCCWDLKHPPMAAWKASQRLCVDAVRGRACPIGVGPANGARAGGTAAAVPDGALRNYRTFRVGN